MTFLSALKLMPGLLRALALHKHESDSSARYDMKYLGGGITPSSCCLGNPIIITLLFNFLTS